MQLFILKIICKILLPKDLWIGNHCYCNKTYQIIAAKLNYQGILQRYEAPKKPIRKELSEFLKRLKNL